MASSPTWQMRIGPTIWTDFDSATSGLFEAGFVSGPTHIVQISGRISGPSVTQDFDVHKMEWGGIPVRRACNAAVPITVEYWDDEVWEPFDSYAQCLIATAMAIGREKVAIHMGSASYDIILTPGNYMQTNRDTGRSRPLRISGSLSLSTIMGDSDDEEAKEEEEEEEEEEVKDDPNMPNEYRCPITQMPMKKPVMLCDGHSYECRAIQKWLMKGKSTSPVTGKKLENDTLIINHALKKLIRDWTGSPNTAASSSGAGSSSVSLKRLAEEDLFGDESDDESASGLVPSIPAVTKKESTAPRMKRMKAMRK